MNKYVLSIALLVASTGAFAQNRLVKKAQGLINNNQIEEAQTLLTEALNSGETKDMALAWDVQGDLYQRLFADELNKAAAHQPLDTAKFAKNLYACLDAYEKCNEYDEKKEYAEKNKGNLMKFRTFLMYVGQFDFQNQNFAGAYKAYDAWLTYPQNHKLVADEPKVLNDTSFARWLLLQSCSPALICGRTCTQRSPQLLCGHLSEIVFFWMRFVPCLS